MTIDSLAQLNKLMLLCKKNGVDKIKIDNIEFTIDISSSPKPTVVAPTFNQFDPTSPIASPIPTPDELTDEQKLFWSAPNGESA